MFSVVQFPVSIITVVLLKEKRSVLYIIFLSAASLLEALQVESIKELKELKELKKTTLLIEQKIARKVLAKQLNS